MSPLLDEDDCDDEEDSRDNILLDNLMSPREAPASPSRGDPSMSLDRWDLLNLMLINIANIVDCNKLGNIHRTLILF